MSINRVIKQIIPERLHPLVRGLRRTILGRGAKTQTYQSRLSAEIENYSNTESAQDVPPIMHYWSNRHLVPMLRTLGFENSQDMFRTYIEKFCRNYENEVKVLSLCSGDSAMEIRLAQFLLERGIRNFKFQCLDINGEVLDRGRRSATLYGLAEHFGFGTFDVNRWNPESIYHVVLANQCLHHVVELESLFDGVYRALAVDGIFLIDDMIGRNGHQRWPEALRHVKQFWNDLPVSYRFNAGSHRIDNRFENSDFSIIGFEGIRAEDILSLLVERFHFDFFFGFGNVVDVFLDRVYGPNFDPNREWDRAFIDRVHELDVREMEAGRLTPTHMFAACTKSRSLNPKFYRHMTPEFCMRKPYR